MHIRRIMPIMVAHCQCRAARKRSTPSSDTLTGPFVIAGVSLTLLCRDGSSMDVQECLAEVKHSLHISPVTAIASSENMYVQVKRCMGKDAYKSVFLPLLRVYRQDQDVPKLSTGKLVFRSITVPTATQGINSRAHCRLAQDCCTLAAGSPTIISSSYPASNSSTAELSASTQRKHEVSTLTSIHISTVSGIQQCICSCAGREQYSQAPDRAVSTAFECPPWETYKNRQRPCCRRFKCQSAFNIVGGRANHP